MVLRADGVHGTVIRPGVVYGRAGGLTGMWFKGASNGGVLRVVGDGHNHWAMVHVDDLAQAYLRAAQSVVGGEVFNVVDASRATVMETAGAAAQSAGNIRQLEFIPVDTAAQEMGAMAQALALDQVVDAAKARRLLNWQPRHRGFVSEVDTYHMAWKASRQS
jgi:nucleoside-diphosphate-sugar epimerase